MKRLATFFLTATALCTAAQYDQSVIPSYRTHLAINNRPLVRIHGRTISLMDVVKKMDVFINENKPELFSSEPSLYQFYLANWKDILEDLVTTEMILSDAEDKEIKVTEGDVREELENRFGPHIASTLDKLHLTYDEALEMVEREMIVDRMRWYKVHSKARQQVTPKVVRDAYQAYLTANPPKTELAYRLFSIRGADRDLCASLAARATELMRDHALDELKQTLESELPADAKVAISLSNEYKAEEKSLSSDHRAILSRLGIDECSDFVSQKSRRGDEVFRLYHLTSKDVEEPLDFQTAYGRIENQLLGQKVQEGEAEYVAWLKTKYNLTDDVLTGQIDPSYEPFALQ